MGFKSDFEVKERIQESKKIVLKYPTRIPIIVEKDDKCKLNNINKNLFIKDKENQLIDDNLIASIITPDKDIVPNSKNLEPAYIVFENYEKILQWNRSLRFGLAVCTLKDKFENVL